MISSTFYVKSMIISTYDCRASSSYASQNIFVSVYVYKFPSLSCYISQQRLCSQ